LEDTLEEAMAVYAYYCTTELEEIFKEKEFSASLQSEELAINTYCLQKGWYLAQSFTDLSCTLSDEFSTRPSASEMLKCLAQGDVVVCSQLKRIFTHGEEVVKSLPIFTSRGVALHILDLGGSILSETDGVSFPKVAESFAALEKRRSKERIKKVKKRQKDEGRYLGGSRPFGYSIHDNGRLIENAMEQRVVKTIVSLKEEGKSLRAISSAVSTPIMPISFKTVQRVLQRHQNASEINSI
jgi:DNA invertase Pin-like site-specific DNA recombinase